jgi:hypothetical protein
LVYLDSERGERRAGDLDVAQGEVDQSYLITRLGEPTSVDPRGTADVEDPGRSGRKMTPEHLLCSEELDLSDASVEPRFLLDGLVVREDLVAFIVHAPMVRRIAVRTVQTRRAPRAVTPHRMR